MQELLFVTRCTEVTRNYPRSGDTCHSTTLSPCPDPASPPQTGFSHWTAVTDHHALFLLEPIRCHGWFPHPAFNRQVLGTYQAPGTQLPESSAVNGNDLLPSASKVTKHPNLPGRRGFLGLGALGIKTGTIPGKSGRVGHSVMSLASTIFYGSLS